MNFADLFTESTKEYAYHVTLAQFIPAIAKEGLRPHFSSSAGEDVIFVEEDEKEAAIYMEPPRTVMLRFEVPGFGSTEDGEAVVYNVVPPQEIEVKQAGVWKRIIK
jgi:hypothetical protein